MPKPTLKQLFEQHGPMVYRRAMQLMGNPADADEATQEVFIRAAAALPRFDPKARFSTWLHRITTNYCLNQLRNRGLHAQRLSERGDELAPAGLGVDPDKMMLMRQLLAEADPQQAEAAVAVFVDGLSHLEAAKRLGVSRRTVGNLCDRFTRWAQDRLDTK